MSVLKLEPDATGSQDRPFLPPNISRALERSRIGDWHPRRAQPD